MSLRAVQSFCEPLPRALRDQVVGYARSVSDAFFNIAREAQVRPHGNLQNQLVFVAGIKRLYSLLRADYWLVENAISLLKSYDVDGFQLGRQTLAGDTPEHRDILAAYQELRGYLEEEGLWHLVQMNSYPEILKELDSERRTR